MSTLIERETTTERDTRAVVSALGRILDDLVPPVLRDRRALARLLYWPLLRRHTSLFLDFKQRAPRMSPEEFVGAYAAVADIVGRLGPTDLNRRCEQRILELVVGHSVLDAGAGRGHLTRLLARDWSTTACDIVVGPQLVEAAGPGNFVEASIEDLPFPDGAFDTVVCVHTLEHVQHLEPALAELRRVASKRLVLVLPRQRPYTFTPNLHLHFFPYAWSVQALGPGRVENLGDWLYVEDLT